MVIYLYSRGCKGRCLPPSKGPVGRDRTTKLRHYARAGIPQYVILNLGERTAEEYLRGRQAAGRARHLRW